MIKIKNHEVHAATEDERNLLKHLDIRFDNELWNRRQEQYALNRQEHEDLAKERRQVEARRKRMSFGLDAVKLAYRRAIAEALVAEGA